MKNTISSCKNGSTRTFFAVSCTYNIIFAVDIYFFSGNKKTIGGGSETIPRRLPFKLVNNSLYGSLPNVDSQNFNSSSDIKLNCVSSQTTIQSDYYTPTDNFSIIFTP